LREEMGGDVFDEIALDTASVPARYCFVTTEKRKPTARSAPSPKTADQAFDILMLVGSAVR
jgi:hypothetical protein